MPPPASTASKRKAADAADEADEESDDENGDDDGEEVDRTPVSHEIILKDHTKVS
jgi:hypothetical protein